MKGLHAERAICKDFLLVRQSCLFSGTDSLATSRDEAEEQLLPRNHQ
ncbi:hypothetical protein [Bifidobacterium sp.]|jgi:hypothetical protein|nr:hypothetical protein [Bifidobacterium sp.]MCH4209946.1 hypothetical protein [Bifidobacterium sp.]